MARRPSREDAGEIKRLVGQLERAEARASSARRDLAEFAVEYGDSFIAHEADVSRQAVRKWRITYARSFHNRFTPTGSKLT